MAVDSVYSDATDETFDLLASPGNTDTTANTISTTFDGSAAEEVANAHFDVYGEIGSGSTITACTLKWVNVSYTVDGNKPPTSEIYNVEICTATGGTSYYDLETDKVYSSGAASSVLDATARGHIGSGVGEDSTEDSNPSYDTHIRWTVDDPGSGRSRLLEINAYELLATSIELEVTYTAAGGATRTAVIGMW